MKIFVLLAGGSSANIYSTVDYGTTTETTTTVSYTATEPTTTTSSPGSTWNPFMCGNCIGGYGECCCRPEHRPYCDYGVNLPAEWRCESGDYLTWSGVEIELNYQIYRNLEFIKNKAHCRHECDNTDWCQAFHYYASERKCTLIEKLYVSDEFADGIRNVVGMKCDHAANQTPDRDPDGYMWSTCKGLYDSVYDPNIIGNPNVPQCDKNGNWKTKQCQPNGYCHCVDKYGVKVPGSKNHGDVKCNAIPQTKAESLRDRLLAVISDNIKSSRSLQNRVNKTTNRMIAHFERNLFACGFSDDEDFDLERSNMNACDNVRKWTKRLQNWASTFNACNPEKSGKYADKMVDQLNMIKSKAFNRLDC